jgi:hypothetical protein
MGTTGKVDSPNKLHFLCEPFDKHGSPIDGVAGDLDLTFINGRVAIISAMVGDDDAKFIFNRKLGVTCSDISKSRQKACKDLGAIDAAPSNASALR